MELTSEGIQKDHVQRKIDKIDKEIDDIVHKLYRISKEEKKIIEGKRKEE